jgi:hypothetical protein
MKEIRLGGEEGLAKGLWQLENPMWRKTGPRGQPLPLPCAVWLVVSAASPKDHIYSCFYAMLVTRSTVIFHRMHKQVKPNHCANQTCKTKPFTRAWHQPCTGPATLLGVGIPEGVSGKCKKRLAKGIGCPNHTHAQGVLTAPTQGQR